MWPPLECGGFVVTFINRQEQKWLLRLSHEKAMQFFLVLLLHTCFGESQLSYTKSNLHWHSRYGKNIWGASAEAPLSSQPTASVTAKLLSHFGHPACSNLEMTCSLSQLLTQTQERSQVKFIPNSWSTKTEKWENKVAVLTCWGLDKI